MAMGMVVVHWHKKGQMLYDCMSVPGMQLYVVNWITKKKKKKQQKKYNMCNQY